MLVGVPMQCLLVDVEVDTRFVSQKVAGISIDCEVDAVVVWFLLGLFALRERKQLAYPYVFLRSDLFNERHQLFIFA